MCNFIGLVVVRHPKTALINQLRKMLVGHLLDHLLACHLLSVIRIVRSVV